MNAKTPSSNPKKQKGIIEYLKEKIEKEDMQWERSRTIFLDEGAESTSFFIEPRKTPFKQIKPLSVISSTTSH